MLLSLNVLDVECQKGRCRLGQVAVFAPIIGPLSDQLASGGVHMRLGLKQASSSRLHDGDEMKRRQTLVVFQLLDFRQRPLIRLIGQSVNVLLGRIVSPEGYDFPCRIHCEAFSQWLDEPVKYGDCHEGSIP